VGLVEGLKVELVDDVEDEPGQVAVGKPLAQVGREQEPLVAVGGQEVVGHGLFYLLAALTPNVMTSTTCSTGTRRLAGCLGGQEPGDSPGGLSTWTYHDRSYWISRTNL
jgi:hypothetical protein